MLFGCSSLFTNIATCGAISFDANTAEWSTGKHDRLHNNYGLGRLEATDEAQAGKAAQAQAEAQDGQGAATGSDEEQDETRFAERLKTTTTGEEATTRLKHQLNSTTHTGRAKPAYANNVPYKLCDCWRWHDPDSHDHADLIADEVSLGFAKIKIGNGSLSERRFHLSSCGTGGTADNNGIMHLIVFDKAHNKNNKKNTGRAVGETLASIKAVIEIDVSVQQNVRVVADQRDADKKIFTFKGTFKKATNRTKLDNNQYVAFDQQRNLVPGQVVHVVMIVNHNTPFSQGHDVKYHHDHAGQTRACLKFSLDKNAVAVPVGVLPPGGLKVLFVNTNQGNQRFTENHEKYLRLMFNFNLNPENNMNMIAERIQNPYSGGRTAPHIIVFAQQEAKFNDGNGMLGVRMLYTHFYQRGYQLFGRDYWSGSTKPKQLKINQMGTSVLIHESIAHNLRTGQALFKPYRITRQSTKTLGLKGASTIHLRYKGLDGRINQEGELLLAGVHMETNQRDQAEQWATITHGKDGAAVGMWVGDFNIRIAPQVNQQGHHGDQDNVQTVCQELVAHKGQLFLQRGQDHTVNVYNNWRPNPNAPVVRYEANQVPNNAFWSYTLHPGNRSAQQPGEKCGFLMDHTHNPYAPQIPGGNYYAQLRAWMGAGALTAARVKECYFDNTQNNQVGWRSGNRNEIDGGWLDRLVWKINPALKTNVMEKIQVAQHGDWDRWGIYMQGFDHGLVMVGMSINAGAQYQHH